MSSHKFLERLIYSPIKQLEKELSHVLVSFSNPLGSAWHYDPDLAPNAAAVKIEPNLTRCSLGGGGRTFRTKRPATPLQRPKGGVLDNLTDDSDVGSEGSIEPRTERPPRKQTGYMHTVEGESENGDDDNHAEDETGGFY